MSKNPAAVALGSIKSEKKAKSSKENGLDQRPHVTKIRHFLEVYPHKLISNEWKEKFPLNATTKKGRVMTYNPDFYCPTNKEYIEVATSYPNISEQGWKWAMAIEMGYNLRVFWWEGQEITKKFTPRSDKSKVNEKIAKFGLRFL